MSGDKDVICGEMVSSKGDIYVHVRASQKEAEILILWYQERWQCRERPIDW